MAASRATEMLSARLGGDPPFLRPGGSPRKWIVLGVACLLLVVVSTGVDAWTAFRTVSSEARSGEQALASGLAELHGLSLETPGEKLTTARTHFREARQHFGRANRRVKRDPLLWLAGWVPLLGDQVAATKHLLNIGEQLSDFGERSMALAASASAMTRQKSSKAPGERLADFVQTQAPTVRSLDSEIAAVTRERHAVPSRRLLPEMKNAVNRLDEKLNRLEQGWKDVPTWFAAAQFLLGVDAPRTFLVLDLDSAELRSAGGFIGSFGYLHITRGKVDRIEFRDVYTLAEPRPPPGDLRYVEPPGPLARHLSPSSLGFRDATWWPDFPTSAAMSERLLKQAEGTTVDGVIGINPPFVAQLLGLVGPVRVPWLNDTFDASNFYVKSIFNSGLIPPPPGHQRKEFLGYIGNEVKDRLFALPGDRLPTVVKTVDDACLRRDLQATFHNQAAMAAVDRLKCQGSLLKTNGDFLLVTSAMSLGKNNAWLERAFNLKVTPGPPGFLRHELSMHFVNRAPSRSPYIAPYYEAFIRVLVPSGSKWVATNGGPLAEQSFVPSSDGGYAEMAGLLRTVRNVYDVTLVYDVPATHAGELLWQRQSGTAVDPVSVSVNLNKSQAWTFGLDRDRVLSFPR